MQRTAWARRLPVVTTLVVGLLCTTGCATIVIGRPSSMQPSPDNVPAGEVEIVGATDDPVDELARNALADLQDFWGSTCPDVFGQQFQPLSGGYFSVDPDDVDPREYPGGVVGCGAQPLEAENNAFYCQAPNTPHSDAITYDRAFLTELADDFGRFIPALVMAHEFGHAVQARVGPPQSSIATETQADCYAGSWTRWVADGKAEHSRLREPELDELLRGYLKLRDPVGTGTAAQSAHGSYFDRVSAFQEGFDDGAVACRDHFGPERVFTQGRFTSDKDFARHGDAPYGELWTIVDESLPTVWDQAFSDVFHEDFTEPSIQRYRGDAPDCAGDPDLELVFCGADRLVGIDEPALARPAYEDIGDFAVATAVSVPYSLSVRDQLGLSTDDGDAVESAVCLTGWYAAKVFKGEAGKITVSPGDIDESVQFLLTYGNDPEVLPDADLSGFQLVDLFRNGFLRGLESCQVEQ
jgi:predicted metalloprotease